MTHVRTTVNTYAGAAYMPVHLASGSYNADHCEVAAALALARSVVNGFVRGQLQVVDAVHDGLTAAGVFFCSSHSHVLRNWLHMQAPSIKDLCADGMCLQMNCTCRHGIDVSQWIIKSANQYMLQFSF